MDVQKGTDPREIAAQTSGKRRGLTRRLRRSNTKKVMSFYRSTHIASLSRPEEITGRPNASRVVLNKDGQLAGGFLKLWSRCT